MLLVFGLPVGRRVLRGVVRLAKLEDGILQCPHAGIAQRLSRGIESVILPDERRNTLAVAVCLPWRPSKFWRKFWRRLDEHAERNGSVADGDRGADHLIRCRVDHR